LNSWGGNLCARYIAGIYRIRDCTAGFRAIRVSLLKRMEFDKIKVNGYCFQITLLYQAILHNAKILEIPVEFIDRERGTSKLGISDIIEFILHVWLLRLQSSKTFIKFCIVGLSGVLVNLGTMTVLLNIGWNRYIASPLSIEAAILNNFILNYYWTFKTSEKGDHISIKGIKFNIVSLLSLAINFIVFLALTALFPSLPPQVPQAIGIIPAMFSNYFLNLYWTFKAS
jgi:dolichol-phosphate mannosyltransferase